jgi:hypothetical protein
MQRRFRLAGLVLALASAADAADFTGKFHAPNDALVIELKPAGGDQYTGTITGGGQASDLTATAKDQKISGKFTIGGTGYTFDGTLDGDQLTVTTGGANYVMTRAPAGGGNPFGAGSATAAKAGAPAADGDKTAAAEVIPPEGKVLATNDFGKTLFFEHANIKDMSAAVTATAAALSKRLGAPVRIETRFEDQKHPGQGVAGFSATVAGKPVHGSMLCGETDRGEGVAVMFARAGAPVLQAAQLVAALPGRPPLHTFVVPDGTGTIGLPDGWTLVSNSLFGVISVKGPADQSVNLNVALPVLGAQSPLVRIYNQNVAFAQAHPQFAHMPPPLKGILLGELCKPVDAVKLIIPQIDKLNREAGKPGIELDEFTEVHDVPPAVAGMKAQSMDYLSFKIDGQTRTHMRSVARGESDDTTYGTWLYQTSGMSAPADHFDDDAATMYAILQSIKPDMKVMQQKLEDQLEANKQLSEDQRRQMLENNKNWQRQHEEQLAGYAKHNEEWRERNVVQDKLHKDFLEYIRGYRTVEDTKTGKQTDVDLGRVGEVMDQLNHDDPGRYKEIKERDK